MVRTFCWIKLMLLTAGSLAMCGVACEDSPRVKNQTARKKHKRLATEKSPLYVGNMNWSDGNVAWMKSEALPGESEDMQLLMTESTISPKNDSVPEQCPPPSIDDFPPDGFSDQDRKNGWLVVNFLIMLYACYSLTILCNNYFVPCLEAICEKLNLPPDVTGATFMAAGTSAPELFESFIGTFITKGDIGVGTIIGSAVFNVLAVTAGCGLLAGMVVPLDWYPLTRDIICYTICVVSLSVIVYDGKIFWYESVILLALFILYVILLSKNKYVERRSRSFLHKMAFTTRKIADPDIAEKGGVDNPVEVSTELPIGPKISEQDAQKTDTVAETDRKNSKCSKTSDKSDEAVWRPCTPWSSRSIWSRIGYIIGWPANLLFFLTVPNPKNDFWQKFYPLTFIVSVIYIGTFAYIIVWMVTIMGFTFGIPDTVMGITFIAIGSSTPEGFSSIVVSRKGYGNMAISNSVGSNVFDFLFCLSVPWLLKAIFFPVSTPDGSDGHYVQIKSSGLVYSVTALLVLTLLMYVSIVCFKFQMNKRVGVVCLALYAFFLAFATLVEMNVLGEVNPECIS